MESRSLPANRRDPPLAGLLASGPFLKDKLLALVEPYPDGRTGSLAARGASLVHVQQIRWPKGAAGHS